MESKSTKRNWPFALASAACGFAVFLLIIPYYGEGIAQAVGIGLSMVILAAKIKWGLHYHFLG